MLARDKVDLAAGGDTRGVEGKAPEHGHKKVRLRPPLQETRNDALLEEERRFGKLKRLPPIQPLENTNEIGLSVSTFNIDLTADDLSIIYNSTQKKPIFSRISTTQTKSITFDQNQSDDNSNRVGEENTDRTKYTKSTDDKRKDIVVGVNNNHQESVDKLQCTPVITKSTGPADSLRYNRYFVISVVPKIQGNERSFTRRTTKSTIREQGKRTSFISEPRASKADFGRAKKKELEYEPSYKMYPDLNERFNSIAVKRIIQRTADPFLSNFEYSGIDAAALISQLSTRIIKKIKLQQAARRHKLVCLVHLLQLSGQSAAIADRCLWYKDTDSVAVYTHHHKAFACVITVHGLYKD